VSGGDQEDGAQSRYGIAGDVSLQNLGGIKTGMGLWPRDESGGYPLTGQVVPGMEAT
jgi:hypothetical protein